MRFDHFSKRAHVVFDEIPPHYKEGIEGIEVSRRTVLHPSLPDVFTLGECLSEHYPSDFGGEIRSRIHLYYGSFLELSRQDEGWDWEEEIFETITHEIRHHLEHLADDDALVDADVADDHNFARREGQPFDPLFFRGGEELAEDLYDVSGDLFYEVREKDLMRLANGREALEARLGDARILVALPDEAADVHYLRLDEPPVQCRGDFYLVLVRRKGAFRGFVNLLRGRSLHVLESEAELLPS